MVRLKAKEKNLSLKNNVYFNSSMVRLKDLISAIIRIVPVDFNSSMVRLKGIIASLTAFNMLNFNSSMVRLKDIKGTR
jgi:hypothetical protein